MIEHTVKKIGSPLIFPHGGSAHNIKSLERPAVDLHQKLSLVVHAHRIKFKDKISDREIDSRVHCDFKPLKITHMKQRHRFLRPVLSIRADRLFTCVHGAVIHADDLVFFKV